MLNLLTVYSIKEILTFIVIMALAIKGCWSWVEWAIEKNKNFFHKSEEKEELRRDVDDLKARQVEMQKVIELLSGAELADLRSFLVREYNYFVHQKGMIDHYSLDCILKSYEMYKKLDGNSYVEALIEEIKALPKIDLGHNYTEGE